MFKYLAMVILMTGCCRQDWEETIYENVEWRVEDHEAKYDPRCC